MAKIDPQVLAHLEWIGYIQPTGLVVSAPALVRAGAILDRRDAEGQILLRERVEQQDIDAEEGPTPWLPDFRAFASSVLGWSFSSNGYAGTADNPIPPELEVVLSAYDETLRPDFAVREFDPEEGSSGWQLLVTVLDTGQGFDDIARSAGRLEASPHGRMERLLRHTSVPAGLLFNGSALRLISAPRGESSGWMDFRVSDMVQTAGRPICTALRLLLNESRLLALPQSKRLAALLEDSRKYQNEVSERLAEQVLHALYELLRGFQGAHDASKGELLREPLQENPNDIYHSLLTVILRLVFLLYAEERGMLPENQVFQLNYSLASLHKRLQEDAALFPDTMDQRFGAWPQLLVLFRMIFDGAECGEDMKLPQRHGALFDPDRFPFLEGRPSVGGRQKDERIDPPLVPDGAVFRALEDLLVLDGERISYRALDVEQIGSVYETMMGFRLETATGRSLAVKSPKQRGAPTVVDLDELVNVEVSKRSKWVQDNTERKLSPKVLEVVKDAENLNELHAALHSVIDTAATPDLVPPGAMILQPSEERRKSGSHYTPRELTQPIVEMTLEPILRRLREEAGGPPKPDQILDLKVCDPAMGSGAFLVEACRQLGDTLIESWDAHNARPEIPQDEDDVVFARRLIAQRCLYGVDRNPVAVDLAKVSLWLLTLAKDHPLTFVDHALRHGDSLVGLSRSQLEAFHWEDGQPQLQGLSTRNSVDTYAKLRRQIHAAGEEVEDWQLRDLWNEAQTALSEVRLYGDLVIAAFFDGSKAKEREAKRNEYENDVITGNAEKHRSRLVAWREADQPLVPFHWEVEFPEVFDREYPGFDASVGNPPFLGGTKLQPVLGGSWRSFVVRFVAGGETGTRGAGDLAAYFVRRTFDLARKTGTVGLVTTNSICQGDTRHIGLAQVVAQGGVIFAAKTSGPWPGTSGTEISQIWYAKGRVAPPYVLDGKNVDEISSSLGLSVPERKPDGLVSNRDLAFEGAKLIGSGFILDRDEAQRLIAAEDLSSEVVRPFLSGIDINSRSDGSASRWAINFWDWPLSSGPASSEPALHVAEAFPRCLEIVRERVRPSRMAKPQDSAWNKALHARWWQYGLWRPALYNAIKGMERVLVRSRVSNTHAVAFSPTNVIFRTPPLCLLAIHGPRSLRFNLPSTSCGYVGSPRLCGTTRVTRRRVAFRLFLSRRTGRLTQTSVAPGGTTMSSAPIC